MGRIRRSGLILKASFSVLRGNKKLLLFPAVTGACLVVVAAFFIGALFVASIASQPTGHPLQFVGEFLSLSGVPMGTNTSDSHIRNWGTVCLAFLYFVSMFLATFFNVAFYEEIIHALNGQSVSITRGMRFALGRLKPILCWSLLAGIVGYVIRTLAERMSFVGRWIMSLVGIAWSISCVFVIPAIIREPVTANPIRYLRSSALNIRRTWGEFLVGYLGVQFGWILPMLLAVPALAVSIWLGLAHNNPGIPIVSIWGVWLTILLGCFYIAGVAEKIYVCALYIYATEGVIPANFDEESMKTAWKVKKRQDQPERDKAVLPD